MCFYYVSKLFRLLSKVVAGGQANLPKCTKTGDLHVAALVLVMKSETTNYASC